MRKHSQHNNDERTPFSRKRYLSHYIRNGCERVMFERVSWRLNKLQNIDPKIPLPLAALLSRSAGLLSRRSWGPIALCWVLVLSKASYLQLTDSKLTVLPVAPGYIIVWHPLASCGRHICTQFNLSTVNIIPLISSTGFTCSLIDGWIKGQYATIVLLFYSVHYPSSLNLYAHTRTHTYTHTLTHVCEECSFCILIQWRNNQLMHGVNSILSS